MYHISYVIRYVPHMICDIYVIARSALSLYHWYVAHTDMWYMWLLRQCAMCDLWSLRWQAFSPMCDAASQLVVTTNRPNIDPTHLSDLHNTENIDRPLARDLTPKIFSATKSANSCQSIKCASYNFTSLSIENSLRLASNVQGLLWEKRNILIIAHCGSVVFFTHLMWSYTYDTLWWWWWWWRCGVYWCGASNMIRCDDVAQCTVVMWCFWLGWCGAQPKLHTRRSGLNWFTYIHIITLFIRIWLLQYKLENLICLQQNVKFKEFLN